MDSNNGHFENPQNFELLLETIKKDFKINGKSELLLHLLYESGHVYENNTIRKIELIQRYEKLIRMQHLQYENLQKTVMTLRFQNEKLLMCISNLKDSLSEILYTPGSILREDKQSEINDSSQEKRHTFDPIVARNALINSRTKSAPQIDINNEYPMGFGKVNSGYPMFSTSTTSLNSLKDPLMYPFSANFPIVPTPVSIWGYKSPVQEEKNLNSKFKVKLLTQELIREEQNVKNENKKRKRSDKTKSGDLVNIAEKATEVLEMIDNKKKNVVEM